MPVWPNAPPSEWEPQVWAPRRESGQVGQVDQGSQDAEVTSPSSAGEASSWCRGTTRTV